MKVHNRFCVVVALLLLATSCSTGAVERPLADDPSSTSSTTPQADTSGGEAAAESIAPTPTASPIATETPDPSPTPTPIPTTPPLFTRVVLPDGSVNDPQRAMFDAAGPTGSLPWLGVGHEYSAATGRSLPLAWAFDADDVTDYEYLPLPPDAFAGNAFDASAAFDSQVATGRITENQTRRAAVWQRSTTDGWSVDADIASRLVGQHEGDSAVVEVAGSSSLLIALLTVESPTGETRRYPITTSDIEQWELVDLPGTDADNWQFGVHADGANGLIIAKLSDEEDPVSRIFTTNDAGASWQVGDVASPNNHPVSLRDAIIDDGQWFAVGSMTTDDGQEPVTFSFADQAWEVSSVSFDFGTIDAIEDGTFVAVARLGPEELVAIVDTDPGSRTFISADGREWTHAPRHWLNRGDPSSTVNFGAMSDEPAEEGILVARGFNVPVWLARNGTTRTDGAAFDGTNRQIDAIVPSSDGFFMFTHEPESNFSGTDIWQYIPTGTWELLGNDSQVVPGKISNVSDAIFIDGADSDDVRLLRIIGGSEIEIDIWDLLSVDSHSGTSRFTTAPAAGRNLLLIDVETEGRDYVQVTFVDLDDPVDARPTVVPNSSGYSTSAVCPQLSSGETTIVLRNPERIGERLEVWADQAEPFVGASQLAGDTNGFANAVIPHCFAIADDLLAIGGECPDDARLVAECQAQVWVSDTGLSWIEHPLNDALTDANETFLWHGASIGHGVVFAGVRNGSAPATLWLATKDDIFEIPTDGLFSLNEFDIDEIVASQGQLLVRSGSDVFVANVDALLAQTLPDEAALQEWTLAAQEPVPTFDPSTAEQPPASTPVSPPSQSSNPTPVPAPAQTAVPAAPTPTPVPSPAQRPTCNPGDITTTGACVCSGGRLFDNGGQCIMRCLSSEDPDGFGGCTRRDGSQVEPVPLATVEFTFEVPADD